MLSGNFAVDFSELMRYNIHCANINRTTNQKNGGKFYEQNKKNSEFGVGTHYVF